MPGEIPFRMTGRGLDLGASGHICFGCGADSTRQATVIFESFGGGGLLARVRATQDRLEFSIPVCAACNKVLIMLRVKLLLACALTLIGGAGGLLLFVAQSSPPQTPNPLLLAIPAVLGGIPALFAASLWLKKDRGAGFVTPAVSADGQFHLQVDDPRAARRIFAAQRGDG